MIERDLKERFEELRAEEGRGIPRFRVPAPRRPSPRRLVPLAAAASLLLLLVIVLETGNRSPQVTFTPADRAAVESMATWSPPTDFLLQTPGAEILTSTPVIPEPMKGVSP